MNIFLSEFTNKVDKKGRISLPSIFRNALPKNNKNEIILFKSIKFNSIEGCNSKRINEIAERINKLDIFSDDQDDFATSIFSEIVPTNLDKEGNINSRVEVMENRLSLQKYQDTYLQKCLKALNIGIKVLKSTN
mgnify:CR=1 FL=1